MLLLWGWTKKKKRKKKPDYTWKYTIILLTVGVFVVTFPVGIVIAAHWVSTETQRINIYFFQTSWKIIWFMISSASTDPECEVRVCCIQNGSYLPHGFQPASTRDPSSWSSPRTALYCPPAVSGVSLQNLQTDRQTDRERERDVYRGQANATDKTVMSRISVVLPQFVRCKKEYSVNPTLWVVNEMNGREVEHLHLLLLLVFLRVKQ